MERKERGTKGVRRDGDGRDRVNCYKNYTWKKTVKGGGGRKGEKESNGVIFLWSGGGWGGGTQASFFLSFLFLFQGVLGLGWSDHRYEKRDGFRNGFRKGHLDLVSAFVFFPKSVF